MIPDPVHTMIEALRSTLDEIGGTYASMSWVDEDGETVSVSLSRTPADRDVDVEDELVVVAGDE